MENKKPPLWAMGLYLLYFFASCFLVALVVQSMLNRFIFPLFPILSIPPISYFASVGLILFAEIIDTYFSKKQSSSKNLSIEDFTEKVGESISRLILILILWGLSFLITLGM